jgi:hypothetical protein
MNEDVLLGTRRGIAAILFLQGVTAGYDVFSAVNSSPWTAESFGGDPEKEASLREYINHGLTITLATATASSFIAGSPWPFFGAMAACAYMYWLYMRAIGRAKERGNAGWDK